MRPVPLPAERGRRRVLLRPRHFVTSFLPILVAPALGSTAQPTPDAGQVRTLDNGLEVIVVPSGTVPLATVEVVVRNGAFTQLTPEEEGLPHLLEHMLFRGRRDFFRRMGELDGTFNGTTSAEAVTYFVTVPADNVEGAVRLMADLVRDPDFRRSDLEDEKKVVRNEMERSSSDPYYLFRYYQDLHLWGSAAPRKNPGGTLYGVQRATPESLRDYYDRFYVPNNAALVVTGDVNPEDVFEWVEDRFDDWDRGPDPFASLDLPAIPALARDTLFVLPEKASDITFSVSWHGPSSSQDRRDAVLADVLTTAANGMAGPLRRALVDTGWFHEVVVSSEHLNHVGPIHLIARTTPEKLPQAAAELQKVLGRMGEGSFFSPDDVEAAKARITVWRALQREGVAGLAHQIAANWSVAGFEYFRDYETRVAAVGAGDVNDFARRFLHEGRYVVGMLVSQGTISEHQGVLVAALEGWVRP